MINLQGIINGSNQNNFKGALHKDQCSIVGQCIYLDNLLTEKAIYGIVMSKYLRLPTTIPFWERFDKEEPECNARKELVSIGVRIGFASPIWIYVKKS